jgi:hypothetical protein
MWRRCEDEQMWRSEDEQMWRWEDAKMRRCDDEKMWRWEDVLQTPTIGRTLRSDALGKKKDLGDKLGRSNACSRLLEQRSVAVRIAVDEVEKSAHKLALVENWGLQVLVSRLSQAHSQNTVRGLSGYPNQLATSWPGKFSSALRVGIMTKFRCGNIWQLRQAQGSQCSGTTCFAV